MEFFCLCFQAVKETVHPRQLDVQSLNHTAQELTKDSPSEQASPIREDMGQVNIKWENLLDTITDRKVGSLM